MTGVRGVLRELGVRFYEHGSVARVSEGWVALDCPYCGKPGKPGLGIHVRSLKTSCWKCGPHSLAKALADSSGRTVREVTALLAGVATGSPATADLPERAKYLPPEGVVPLDAPRAKPHRAYLRRRGFDPAEIARVWGVGAIGDSIPADGENRPTSRDVSSGPCLRWRLFLPVVVPGAAGEHRVKRHRDDPLASTWTTRAVGPDVEPRYVSAPPDRESVPLKHTLYGLHLVKSAAVVVEGPTDAWRVGPGAVATYGLSVTPAQCVLLSRIPVRVICFDNDPEAQRRARRLADALSPFPGETHVAVLSGKDPADSPADEIEELRRKYLE